jgi:putative ATP-dependent endonuclease of OLD family
VTISMQTDLTPFVGNNGSGKTAVFQALSRIFGITTSQRQVVKSDFHLSVADEGLPSGTVLSIDCVLGFPELVADEDDPSVPDVFYHMAATAEGAPLKLRVRLEASWVEDLTQEGTVTEDIKWVGALDDSYDWREGRTYGSFADPVALRPC